MNKLDTRILTLLEKPMRLDALRKALVGVGNKRIEESLARLTDQGKIVKNKKNRFAQAAHFGCIAGTYLATAQAVAFVRPDEPDGLGDILIPPGEGSGAWNGDKVLVRLREGYSRRGNERREGTVIQLLEEMPIELDGIVRARGEVYLLEPLSRKYPQLEITERGAAQAGEQVSALVTFRGDAHRRPQAALTAVHGREGTIEASIARILHGNGITEPFPADAAVQAESLGTAIPPAAIAGRHDLRDQLIFTIDGDSAKDFDDAISITPLANGHVMLGVHIADVSHYVTPASPLDNEAYRRGTSVYYPGHVIPMLPAAISDGLCSLVPHEDRLAFSAFLEIDQDGRQYNASFAKSVIRSKARMTYNKVNRILDGDKALHEEYAFLTDDLSRMAELAASLRRRRMERGALDLNIPETEVTVDEAGEPIALSYRTRGKSERMIEEFMLMANEAVAAFMHAHSYPAVYRVHENPDPEKLLVFARFARPFGHRVDGSKPQDTHQLQVVLDKAAGDPKQRVLPMLLLRSLARARYGAENLGHYGLQAKFYLHFTSPIRRYPDLATHRMLEKAVSGTPFTAADYDYCENAANQSTAREMSADSAERAIDSLYIAAYMEQFIGDDFDAEVSGVQSFGLFVALPNGAEGLLRIEQLPGTYEYDDEKMVLAGHTGLRYAIGTPLRVRLIHASRVTGQIDFALADSDKMSTSYTHSSKKKKP